MTLNCTHEYAIHTPTHRHMSTDLYSSHTRAHATQHSDGTLVYNCVHVCGVYESAWNGKKKYYTRTHCHHNHHHYHQQSPTTVDCRESKNDDDDDDDDGCVALSKDC